MQLKCAISAGCLVGLGLAGCAAAVFALSNGSALGAIIAAGGVAAGVGALIFCHRSTQPVSSHELKRLELAAFVKASEKYEHMIDRLNAGLEIEVGERLRQSLATRHALIMGLAKLADFRDGETGKHLERLCDYSGLLARTLHDEFDEIDDEWIQSLRLAAALHDIGKVGVPDSVLLKPGRLTIEERELIKRHAQIGADTLIDIRRNFGDDSMINMGIQVTLQHHERWDGKGYPFGLSGDNISLAARIVALADFYDALTSERVYKRAISHQETCEMIHDARGTQFDPAIVDAFERVRERFAQIRRLFGSDPTIVDDMDPLRDVA